MYLLARPLSTVQVLAHIPVVSKESAITILSLRPAFLCQSETFFCSG